VPGALEAAVASRLLARLGDIHSQLMRQVPPLYALPGGKAAGASLSSEA
jgi:hypothetical protein